MNHRSPIISSINHHLTLTTEPWFSAQQADTWQDKMKAGLNQGLAMVQERREHAQKGYEATKERVSTYRAGQELLDKGGLAAESAIRGKTMAKVAIAETEDLLARARAAKTTLEDWPGRSAEAYEAKATLYKMLLETLEDDKDSDQGSHHFSQIPVVPGTLQGSLLGLPARPTPPAVQELPAPPSLTPAEEDAAMLLQFKERAGGQR
eukprot:Skav228467  [mRNA]  locus=scaffold1233:57131:64986:+ [translate_table: standard]